MCVEDVVVFSVDEVDLCVDEVEVEVVCVEVGGPLDEVEWVELEVEVSRWVVVGVTESDVAVEVLGTLREFLCLCARTA